MSTDRTRSVTWDDPKTTASGASGRTGLAFLKSIIEGATPPAPIQALLGFDLIAAEEGLTRFRLTPAEYLYNPTNAVHGGVACTLLDSAMSAAVLSTCDERLGYSTVDVTVHL